MANTLSLSDLRTMRVAGKVAAGVLGQMASFIKAGITTREIELFFEKKLERYPGMEAAFKGFMGYPSSCCVSVNEEIVHGIPGEKLIKEGDLVSVDLGIKYKGLFVDTARTYTVGKVSKEAKRLVKTTFCSLQRAIKKISIDAAIGDIAYAVQGCAEKSGYSVIRKFVGHGIGRQLHLPPEVPNFGDRGQGVRLRLGQAIAVEPMISAGGYEVRLSDDGWTATTADNSLSAHFEHTIAVTRRGAWVLTQ
jgi:methionyl aminopeptidase